MFSVVDKLMFLQLFLFNELLNPANQGAIDKGVSLSFDSINLLSHYYIYYHHVSKEAKY